MSSGLQGIDETPTGVWDRKFREDIAADSRFEASLLFKEIAIVTIMVVLVLLGSVLL
jgi:hypothetical protein